MTGLVPKVMLTIATLTVIAVVAGAIVVLDSPAVAADKKRDRVLVEEFSCMERQIRRTYRDNKALPTATEVEALNCRRIPAAASGVRYVPTGATTYRLCATFRYPSQERGLDWEHPAGDHCVNKDVMTKE